MSFTLHWPSDSAAATEDWAAAFGGRLRGGEVIELRGDLGGGKTTFVRGLARGAGSPDHVSSPTFTVSQEYRAGRLTIHHYDFYRLSDAGIMRDELREVLGDTSAVVVAEWPAAVAAVLPVERLAITFQPEDDNRRRLVVTGPDKYRYLVEEVR